MKRPPSAKVLAKIAAIRVVTWEWADRAEEVGIQPGDKAIGVVAQEIKRIFPELVTKHADGYRRVDYGGLAAIAIAGVQALSAEVADLRVRLEAANKTCSSRARAKAKPARTTTKRRK